MVMFWAVLSLSGCVEMEAGRAESAFITWKSPSIRYSDMGFISDNGKNLKVEIYGSGSALMRLDIGEEMVCMSQYSCMPKDAFNRRFLSAYYPDDTLENIFKAKALFGGKSLVKKRNGFTQNIQKENLYKIVYNVLNKQIIFRDTINHIVIKVIKQ